MRIVVHIDEHGNQNYLADGDVDFFIIDERAPRDRVYQMSDTRVPRRMITKLIGKSRIGRLGDMPGVEAEIRALVNGEPKPKPPPLKLV
jgi:hypothetical protein